MLEIPPNDTAERLVAPALFAGSALVGLSLGAGGTIAVEDGVAYLYRYVDSLSAVLTMGDWQRQKNQALEVLRDHPPIRRAGKDQLIHQINTADFEMQALKAEQGEPALSQPPIQDICYGAGLGLLAACVYAVGAIWSERRR